MTIAGVIESRKDIRKAAQLIGRSEAAYLVNTYYQVQEFRKAAGNMARVLDKEEKPNALPSWLYEQQLGIESDIKIALFSYVQNNATGRWALTQHGIGPVITAGLLAHIDINKAPTVGNIWSFAGLNPAVQWKKGQRRPWNAALKTLCWKIGDSFVKTRSSNKSFYGPIYDRAKELELTRNESGKFAEQAAATLRKRTFRDEKTRLIYESGKLPAGRLDLRARRKAVKLFLSHFHDVLMWNELGRRAPVPYAIQHLGHAHEIKCPTAPWDYEENTRDIDIIFPMTRK